MKPKVSVNEGWTTIDAVVNLKDGLCMRPSGKIVLECSKYPKKIFFKTYVDEFGDVSEKHDCSSIVDVMDAGAEFGAKIRIFVEGEDEEAERFALRFYSAVTDGYEDFTYDPNFDMYESYYRKGK